jgi:hypothetical protein
MDLSCGQTNLILIKPFEGKWKCGTAPSYGRLGISEEAAEREDRVFGPVHKTLKPVENGSDL